MSDVSERVRGAVAFLSTGRGWVVAAVVGLLIGILLHAAVTPSRPVGHGGSAATDGAAEEATIWTCSMHPRIRSDNPGLCPICNMELIPLADAGGPAGAAEFSTSEAGAALMNIATARVRRQYVATDVRMVGKVDYDETRLAYITAWMPGRLDRLFVDNTGVPVHAGEHLASIYSPQLLAAQEEFLQARQAVEQLPEGGGIVRETTIATLEASREKLRLLGISAEQVEELARSGKAADHMTLTSPVTGIVVEKNAREGMYVQTGMRIYTIADLSVVWVKLDAYESDLAWLRYGQGVELTTVAYPGETFEGTISLIHPVLDAGTRTVNVRVNVTNADGRLKPGMFIKAVAHSQLAEGGRVMDSDLAGKYICTMHPEVISDEPGDCPECGMALVRTEALGYVAADEAAQAAPLVIPATAALVTGKRAIVYVKLPDAEQPTFVGRQIVLGPKAGEWYIVREGLAEGEEVVTHGNFKIDSALQIQALPSMMSPEGQPMPGHVGHDMPAAAPGSAERVDVPPAFRRQLSAAIDAYMPLSAALSADDMPAAKTAATSVIEAVRAVDASSLADKSAWTDRAAPLTAALEAIVATDDIEAVRVKFSEVSEHLAALARRFGAERTLYLMKCPMAFNDVGARWLQYDTDVANPYFGASMFRCGEVVETIEAVKNGGDAAKASVTGRHAHE